MIKNDNLLDQFFLIDPAVVEALIEALSINKADRILEIGAGTGIITKKMAGKAKRVWAIEIDERFKEDLKKLPKNVEVIYGDALEVLEEKIKFNKIAGSLPSSLVEPLAHRLTKLRFDLGVFLVPLKFVDNLEEMVFSAYLKSQLIREVGKASFQPRPKTNWALVKIERKPLPLAVKDYERFIQQYLLEHQEAKLGNALREAIIKVYQSRKENLTKNQAREIVRRTKTPPKILESLVRENQDLPKTLQLLRMEGFIFSENQKH